MIQIFFHQLSRFARYLVNHTSKAFGNHFGHIARHFSHVTRHSGSHSGRNLSRYPKKSSGFTLIEVLISAVILFSVLAVTAELYSASSLSSQKANNKAHFYQLTPIAISTIKAEIRQLSENRQYSQFANTFVISNISYHWEAKRVSFKARAEDINDIEPPKQQFGLFLVNVIAKRVIGNSKNTEFKFKVATW